MKKVIANICILLVLTALGLVWANTDSLIIGVLFFIILIPYVILRVYIFLWGKQSQAQNNKTIPYSSLSNKENDTSNWEHKRAIIKHYTPNGNIEDNGVIIGKIFQMMVQIDDDNGSRWTTLIKDKFIPLTHLGSFGELTEVMVLYNPKKKYDAVFDPKNENWHYEKE